MPRSTVLLSQQDSLRSRNQAMTSLDPLWVHLPQESERVLAESVDRRIYATCLGDWVFVGKYSYM
jgi:hypothetical protein